MPVAGSSIMKKPTIAGVLKTFVLLTAATGITFFVYAVFDTSGKNRRIVPDHQPVHKDASDTATLQKQIPKSAAQVFPAVDKTGIHPEAKIQVAILLDVSNSMDGLIDQAKAQLWNMVNTMGSARCDGLQPTFELALYEYGRPNNGDEKGYIRQLHAFTGNLDLVSNTLFGLSTNGGDEYCPQVIVESANDLPWDKNSGTYKAIFIAGNESFRQGKVPWSLACEKARQKGVIVNTIYCGDRQEGIAEYWNLGAECGNGSFTNINQDVKEREIDTPYDSMLFVLNDKLNTTYISYGARGAEASALQADMDKANYTLSKSAAAKRTEVKSKAGLYRNDDWDLVDAMESDKEFLSKMDMEQLPSSLKNMNKAEIEKVLVQAKKERGAVQQQIAVLSGKRNEFIRKELAKPGQDSGTPTLETEIERIIRQQAKRFNMQID
jgi:hypothetical protein